jgi:hypothetical protein
LGLRGKWGRLHKSELPALLLTKYYSGDYIKKNEMGRACSTYGAEEKCIQGFDGET